MTLLSLRYDQNQTSSIEDPRSLVWTWDLVLQTIIFISITLFTVIGNGLVLLSVILNRHLRSPTHIFIGNLALADFLVGVLVLPCNAITQITSQWHFGPTYCILWHCIHLWLCSASILSICAICFDRYIGVSQPLKHFCLMKSKVVKWIILTVWILAFFLGTIPVLIWPETPSDNYYVCKINRQLEVVMVVSVGIFYIPLLIMILLYSRIFLVTRRHISSVRSGLKEVGLGNLRVHVGSESSVQGDGQENDTSTSTAAIIDNLVKRNFKRQVRAAKKLTIVVGAFILCYFPFFTVFLLQSLDSSSVSTVVFEAFGWIRYFNSALNPVIYAAMLPAFRKAFCKIVRC